MPNEAARHSICMLAARSAETRKAEKILNPPAFRSSPINDGRSLENDAITLIAKKLWPDSYSAFLRTRSRAEVAAAGHDRAAFSDKHSASFAANHLGRPDLARSGSRSPWGFGRYQAPYESKRNVSQNTIDDESQKHLEEQRLLFWNAHRLACLQVRDHCFEYRDSLIRRVRCLEPVECIFGVASVFLQRIGLHKVP